MNERLSAKQWVPLTDDEQEALHEEAEARGITRGLLGRALLTHALDHIDDAEVSARIKAERVASGKRIRSGARTAAAARWGTPEGDGEHR